MKKKLMPINLLKPVGAQKIQTNTESTKKFFTWGKIIFFLIIIFLASGCFFTYRAFSSIQNIVESPSKTPIAEQLQYLLSNNARPLRGEDSGYINFLFLGIGGENHPGGKLTDTIIIARLKVDEKKIALISIPRDFVYNFSKYEYRKINNGLVIGEEKKFKNGGAAFMSSAVSDLIGQPIHYYALLDFSGFKKIIDDLGGIDLYVDNAFVDREYPTYNYGWQTIRFDKGWQHMDGEKSLQYSRSRHGNNGEGSDFKRSQRQKKVILAVKDKTLSVYTVLNPTVIVQVLRSIGSHVRTNMEYWEMVRFAQLVKDIQFDQAIQYSIDNSAGGLVHSETGQDGAYILVPNEGLGRYEKIQEKVATIFEAETVEVAATQEDPIIYVSNGTNTAGLAKTAADIITAQNFTVKEIDTSPRRGFEKTVIYDFTNKNQQSLISLKKLLKANVAPSIPAWVHEEYDSKTLDFLIIVGKKPNQQKTSEGDLIHSLSYENILE